MPPGVRLVDPATAVVDSALRTGTLPAGSGDVFVTMADVASMRRSARLAWGVDIPPESRVMPERRA